MQEVVRLFLKTLKPEATAEIKKAFFAIMLEDMNPVVAKKEITKAVKKATGKTTKKSSWKTVTKETLIADKKALGSIAAVARKYGITPTAVHFKAKKLKLKLSNVASKATEELAN